LLKRISSLTEGTPRKIKEINLGYSYENLLEIFEKTNGKCRQCRKELVLDNYGKRNARGGWEVDHSVPKSKGGTDNPKNLLPLCYLCNFYKRERWF